MTVRILLLIYTILYTAGLVLYFLVAPLQRRRKGKRTVLAPRIVPKFFSEPSVPGPFTRCVWVHAVSVGEVNAVKPLVQTLSRIPRTRVILSTTTPTGREVARAQFSNQVSLLYFPLDLGPICRRFLRELQPDLILLVETEIWPNFLAAAKRSSIPTVLVNGRISDRSFRWYSRLAWFFRPVLDLLTHSCMQSKQDKNRMLSLGVDPERVNWVGNLKYDYTPPPTQDEVLGLLAPLLKPTDHDLVLVCGSTKPGEEDGLAGVYRRLEAETGHLRLLIAPRHPHRADEVSTILERAGIPSLRRSRLGDSPPGPPPGPFAVVLDTVGELAQAYQLADLVFVGGSLVPTGGQNLIEPAAWGKPILFGPDMSNFREIAATFLDSYGAIQVQSFEELEARLRDLLRDPHARKWLGANARRVIRDNQGAIQRTMEILSRYLDVHHDPQEPEMDEAKPMLVPHGNDQQ